jgi:glycosyltransferase involved in cell wall biosynthesis
VSRILYIQYTNPAGYPPLEHSSRLLAESGWQVLFLGVGALGAATLRFPRHERIMVRQLSHRRAGWYQKLHYLWFGLWVLAWTLRWSPRWVYASDHLSCPIALLLSVLPGVQVIYHEHDAPDADSKALFQRLSLSARRRVARRAELCVLPNQQRAERFAAETGLRQKVLCVWNCPLRQEVADQRNGAQADDLWLLYHGSIVPARLPTTVVDALQLLPTNVKLRVIGYETIGHRGYVRELQQRAERLGLSGRIEFAGPVPQRAELLALGRKCDVGLAFMPKQCTGFNERTMTGASNKPFDYLACGLALLVSDLPDWREMFVQSGYAQVCDSDEPESIARALSWFLEHRVEMRQMGGRGQQRIATDWNYERQFQPVLERLSQTR